MHNPTFMLATIQYVHGVVILNILVQRKYVIFEIMKKKFKSKTELEHQYNIPIPVIIYYQIRSTIVQLEHHAPA